MTTMALAQLTRVPGRTTVGIITLGVAVAAASSLLGIEIAFRGAVAHDLLGNAVAIYVRGADLASIVVTVVVGGACVADIVYSGMRERRTELATLCAGGWTERDTVRLATLEGLLIGLTGSLLGAAVGCSMVALLGGSAWAVLATGTAAVIAGVAVTVIALIVPVRFLAGTPLLDGIAAGTD